MTISSVGLFGLASIHQELLFPREDVAKLRSDLEEAASSMKRLEGTLDLQNAESWAAGVDGRISKLRQDLARVEALLTDLEARNQVAHENLSRETQSAVSLLFADGKFLEHVREIIRFIKTS